MPHIFISRIMRIPCNVVLARTFEDAKKQVWEGGRMKGKKLYFIVRL